MNEGSLKGDQSRVLIVREGVGDEEIEQINEHLRRRPRSDCVCPRSPPPGERAPESGGSSSIFSGCRGGRDPARRRETTETAGDGPARLVTKVDTGPLPPLEMVHPFAVELKHVDWVDGSCAASNTPRASRRLRRWILSDGARGGGFDRRRRDTARSIRLRFPPNGGMHPTNAPPKEGIDGGTQLCTMASTSNRRP